MSWIDWLNSNEAVVISIATAVTAAATALIAVSAITTAWLTRQLARENRLIRELSGTPKIVAYFTSDSEVRTMINLVLENVGHGPAQDIRFSLDADIEDLTAHDVSEAFTKPSSNMGADLIPAGGSMRSFFAPSMALLGEVPLRKFKVLITFKDLQGKEYQTASEMDVTHFNWISWVMPRQRPA